MNERQKEVLASQLKDEQRVLKELKQVYTKAREDVISNIKALEARTDIENLRAIVYQKNYQEALKKQLDAILDAMNAKQFTTISDYLGKSYEESFFGVLYDLHGQGIPLIFPIDQEQATRAIQLDSKISEGLYQRLGVDTKLLKNAIRANVSRGIASSTSWAQVARNIQNRMNVGMNRAIRIARTEGHRIQNESRFDAQTKAKQSGADVVKQWDSTLDKRTRPTHQQLDGQIREINEPFEIPSNGRNSMYPGGFGIAAEDINCRCAILQRARWALDDGELQTLKDRAAYFGLDKTESFNDFKTKYLKAVNSETEELEELKKKYQVVNDKLDATKDEYADERSKLAAGEYREKQLQMLNSAYPDFADISEQNIARLDTLKARKYREYQRQLERINSQYSTKQELSDKVDSLRKQMQNYKDELSKFEDNPLFYDKIYKSNVRVHLEKQGVEYREIRQYSKSITQEEIIARLGGGDMTEGSCASLGLAYIGNEQGYDVLDFRDGASREIFSRNTTLKDISRLRGVVSFEEKGYDDITNAKKLLKQVDKGKEYYFVTGKHAAIVRKTDDGKLQYLELQTAGKSEYKNGWHDFTTWGTTDKTLKERFGTQKSRTVFGNKLEQTSFMIDSDSLKGNPEFRKLLGYINTSESAQRKGVRGEIK